MKTYRTRTALLLTALTIIAFDFAKAQTIDWTMKANPSFLSINSVAFRADGQKVLTGTNCHPASIRIFDVPTGMLNWDYNVGVDFMCIMGVTFSSNTNYIAAIEEMGNVLVFDNTGATPVILDTINTATSYGFSTAISPDNNKIAVGCSNGRMKIYNIVGGTLSNDINAHQSWVTSVAYSPDGSKIVTGGSDDRMKIWSSTGTLLFNCAGHTDDITSVRVTPDNQFVVSSSKDNTIKIWNIATGTIIQTISGHNHDVNGVDISPDGSKIVSASSDSTCKIWDFNSGSLITSLVAPNSSAVNAVAWSPNGDKIVTGNVMSDVVLWSVSPFLNLNEAVLWDDLKLFPNPGSQQLTIELPFDPQNPQLVVYNQLGQLQKSLTNVSNRYYNLDISELPKGQYYIVIEDAGQKLTSKFVVAD